MKVSIWSDVRCPFCYIGKRKFEKALNKFADKDKVEVVWRSFQLDPNLETKTGINAVDHIAAVKGISQQQAEEMHTHVTRVAKEAGLDFDFEKAVVANSFNAHRLIQLAKTHGLGNEAEEQLFKAHFTEGKNIDDKEVLTQTGVAIGLDEKEIKTMLSTDAFAAAVKQDEQEARDIGVSGVPFFVFNDRYAVSGAQSPDTFLQALQQSWLSFEQDRNVELAENGEACSPGGNCN
ncbi:DsbA family oxidoreductase [Agriterribacter sp.]|uniref:DsbA family oxidoreductase n=1 Tax=Agriterribacter sp. TaxID=2821509 RepID=UPI002C70CDC8|nr:DsbA family oxidoreductase [Agriterribacter sp.]HRO48170.1 DsbA family oxidoreductase [Agriterribacter sp.]HRQ19098.1 DsbA family oxidoreductase [Agriterribacter sp.]